jgi:hypothetical protein
MNQSKVKTGLFMFKMSTQGRHGTAVLGARESEGLDMLRATT